MAIIKSKHPGCFVQWFLSFPRTGVLVGSLTVLHRLRQEYMQEPGEAAGVVLSLITELSWSHMQREPSEGPRTQILRTDSPQTA